ncbi:M48 family metalloprotease [Streptomyces sp. NBC_01476]|uniref:M56 family metallopeptidase n=1 Tax=Streptomyces sp. NBC_01476 TaxID=2903881 RepID=UPI002E36F95C|nr:M48 family metalloprotease [Streptomyces sp. NBC_01476]
MTDALWATLVACLLFILTAPSLGRRLPPSTATRLLVPASLAIAASTLLLLGVLALTWLGQLPAVAALGPWSTSRLQAIDPVPDPLAAVSLLLLTAAAVRTAVTVTRRLRALAVVYQAARGPRSADPVIVLDSAWPDAFTTPAPAARIVVTSGLLQALTPAERRVVLAHEHSHLVHRHVWWTLAAELAAGVNPFLRPTATAAGHAVERWADEDAARSVGDRQLVARTIARTALLQHDAPRWAGPSALAATGGDVSGRVHALLARPPRRRPFALAALTALLIASALATYALERSGEQLFDVAALPAHTRTVGPAAHHFHRHVTSPAAHVTGATTHPRRPAHHATRHIKVASHEAA